MLSLAVRARARIRPFNLACQENFVVDEQMEGQCRSFGARVLVLYQNHLLI